MKVSIIIPAYNAEKYIKRAIDSVKAQTYTDWECIVVDDGSTDLTARIATDETIYNDLIFVYSFERNHGISWSRNFGMEHANGDAVFFLDADDWMEPGCIEYLVSYARNNPEVGRVVSQPIVHWPNGRETIWEMKPTCIHKPNSEYLFANSSCDTGHVTGCLYIRDRIPEDISFQAVPIYEDMLFNMALIFSGVTLGIATKQVYNYVRHSDSITYRSLSVEDARLILNALRDIGEKYNPPIRLYARCETFLFRVIGQKLGDKFQYL